MSLAEKQIARSFIEELLNKGNLENVDTYVTPDFIYHNVAEDLKGVENFKKCAESDHITFHDIQYSFFVDSIAEDGKVAIVCIVEARHVKEFRGIAATHKKVETAVVINFHFQGNKIKEAWAVADGLQRFNLVLLRHHLASPVRFINNSIEFLSHSFKVVARAIDVQPLISLNRR